MNRTAWFLVTTLTAAMAATAAPAQAPRTPKAFPPDIGPAILTLTGVGGKSIEITVADMANFPQHTIKSAEHGVPVSFDGGLLKDVLSRVDLPLGDEFHKTAASYYLVVEAADGYRAVFAWAELDSTFMEKPVYLVVRRDGFYNR